MFYSAYANISRPCGSRIHHRHVCVTGGSLLWLVVVSSVITFGCYLSLVGSIGASRAAYATVVFPIFALAISTVLEGYSWSLLSVGGLALVIAGNLMMIRSRN